MPIVQMKDGVGKRHLGTILSKMAGLGLKPRIRIDGNSCKIFCENNPEALKDLEKISGIEITPEEEED